MVATRTRLRSRTSLLRKRVKDHPSAYLAWLPIQLSFLRDDSKIKLIRSGNQAYGKTEALCAEVRWRCTGTHPYIDVPEPPIRVIVLSPTSSHSRKFQRKFWAGLDKRTIAARTRYDPSIGFRGRVQDCWFTNGSVVEFHSAAAGGLALSGDTVDLGVIDEPALHRLYAELERRVMIRGGYILLGMTPINAPGPLDWLQELCEAGVVSEHHTRMTPESLIPVGHTEPRKTDDGTPMDEAWIKIQRSKVLGHEAAIVLDGEWETPPEGQRFPAFDPRAKGKHVRSEPPTTRPDRFCLGVDHGERDHKQCGVLIGMYDGGVHPELWILDEYVGEGLTTHEQDAAGILAMLSRWGLSWGDLAHVYGDKPHDVRRFRRSVASKSNRELAVAIARQLNIPPNRLRPYFKQAKTGTGIGRATVDYGCRWLHTLMLRDANFYVMDRCERMIKSLQRWDGRDDEWKDIIDALRYAAWYDTQRTRRISGESPLLRSP